MVNIILDLGSGNTCKNDYGEVRKMLNAIHDIDTGKHKITIKWQLWEKPQGNNIKLDRSIFDWAYGYAQGLGYKTTASVFDKESLDYLLTHDVPFVKIACNKELYSLAGEVPRKYIVLVSTQDNYPALTHGLYCVPKYPAPLEDYKKVFGSHKNHGWNGISDHTPSLELFKRVEIDTLVWYEMHYALKGQTGLDVESGVCKTPGMLAEIL